MDEPAKFPLESAKEFIRMWYEESVFNYASSKREKEVTRPEVARCLGLTYAASEKLLESLKEQGRLRRDIGKGRRFVYRVK